MSCLVCGVVWAWGVGVGVSVGVGGEGDQCNDQGGSAHGLDVMGAPSRAGTGAPRHGDSTLTAGKGRTRRGGVRRAAAGVRNKSEWASGEYLRKATRR